MLEQEKISLKDLNSTNVEHYDLSIRLRSNGLTFVIREVDTLKVLLSDTIIIKNEKHSILNTIEEVFFENSWLSLPFSKVTVSYEPVHWILIPFDLFNEQDAHLWLRSITEYNVSPQDRCLKVLSNPIHEDGKVLLCDIEQELYAFLSRTLIIQDIQPYFTHYIDYARDISRNNSCKVLQLFICNRHIDIFVVDKGVIQKGNHYNFTNYNDKDSLLDEVLYFTINMYNSAMLSSSEDRILVMSSSDNMDIDNLISKLMPYTSVVDVIDEDNV